MEFWIKYHLAVAIGSEKHVFGLDVAVNVSLAAQG
jgi:hypothetical protein